MAKAAVEPKRARRARHPTSENDPALIAIAEYTAADNRVIELYRRIEEIEAKAIKKHGSRPSELIAWRDYGHIGGHEIENARDRFIREGFDKRLIAKEYKGAKARHAAKVAAVIQWDKRAGLTKLRAELVQAEAIEHRATARLAKVKPKSTRGAAALLNWVIEDMKIGGREEQEAVLRSVARTLPTIAAQ